jgi:SAM-dependent methyltransferase
VTQLLLSRQTYRYLPYELDLSSREVKALLGAEPQATASGLEVALNGHQPDLAKRLTYTRSVALAGAAAILTDQARLEDSARSNGGLMRDVGASRQSTRYSAHGFHEYRGKFNPQIVRAIGNLLELKHGAWVLDPFCGSGTTLLESAHCGWNCLGIDMNPLGVLISNAKIEAIKSAGAVLSRESEAIVHKLRPWATALDFESAWDEIIEAELAGKNWWRSLPNLDYLTRWFPRPVLAQFAVILGLISEHESIGDILRVILSDLVRRVSLQDPADLRIRRRKDPKLNYPLIPLFIESLIAKVSTVTRAQKVIRPEGIQRAYIADSREALRHVMRNPELKSAGFDAAITSPPYATALPYVDTQRLSLVLLGLIEATQVMALDERLIGTREVSRRARLELEEELTGAGLPEPVQAMCSAMLSAVATSSADGFRRRNMPALVFQYFRDMARVLENVARVIKPGGSFALLIGRNSTVLGGKKFVIDTPSLVAEIARDHGWALELTLELDTYQRFDIHRRNSITQEALVLLRRSASPLDG